MSRGGKKSKETLIELGSEKRKYKNVNKMEEINYINT